MVEIPRGHPKLELRGDRTSLSPTMLSDCRLVVSHLQLQRNPPKQLVDLDEALREARITLIWVAALIRRATGFIWGTVINGTRT